MTRRIGPAMKYIRTNPGCCMAEVDRARTLSHAAALEALPAEHIARQAARRAAMIRAKQAERESLRRLAQALQLEDV